MGEDVTLLVGGTGTGPGVGFGLGTGPGTTPVVMDMTELIIQLITIKGDEIKLATSLL